MKKMKKLVSMLLAAVMVLSIGCISVFAEDSTIIEEPSSMIVYDTEADALRKDALLSSDALSEDEKKIILGEDFHYGIGLDENREWITSPDYDPTAPSLYWMGGGSTYTHQYVTKIAIEILNNDLSYNPLSYDYSALAVASDLPDQDENDYAFVWHFYDPDTGKNYTGGSTTALSKLKTHYNSAVNNYSSNRAYAIEELGRACHYIADLSEPHHASNKVAGLSQHTQFEKYANTNRGNYYTLSMGTDSYNYARNTTVHNIGHNFAIYAKSKVSGAENSSTFDTTASDTMKKTQRNIACLLYKFMIDTDLI